MSDPISIALGKFNETDLTVRGCRLLFEAVPKSPDFVFYRNLQGAAARVGVTDPADQQRAAERAAGDGVGRTLWMVDKLDMEDAALAAVSGVSNIFSWVTGGKAGKPAFEADRNQAIDAVIKMLGTAYIVDKLFEGSVSDRTKALLSVPAGRELVLDLCVIEIAMPFAHKVAEGGWDLVSSHLDGALADGEAKFQKITGSTPAGKLAETLGGVKGILGETMGGVRDHLGAITGKLGSAMPTILNVAGSTTSTLATVCDALPAWRFLGARLAAEACAAPAGSKSEQLSAAKNTALQKEEN